MYFIQLTSNVIIFRRVRHRFPEPPGVWLLSVSAYMQALNAPSLAGRLVRIDNDAVQLGTLLRRFHPAIQTGQEPSKDHVLVNADD
jgi:hypothetical protein